MLNPEAPHSIPSSPISVRSDITDEDPIHAAEFADPSVKSTLDQTGSEDDSHFEKHCSNFKHAKELQEHVIGSSTWTSIVVGSLTPSQKSNLKQRRLIEYGDDCSGARAPYEALCQFVTKLAQEGIVVRIQNKFASECPGSDGDGPRAFIEAQCHPEIMFNTVHRGTDARGLDMHTQKHVLIPTHLTVYSAGWVCKNVSTMNCHRRPLLPGDHPEVIAGKAGASSQTLNSSILYIRTFRPGIVLLENLVNKRNISIATNALKAMGGYSTCVLLIDSRSFAVPMSRRRMYLLAVQTHLLIVPLDELVSQLKNITQSLPNLLDTSLPKLLSTFPPKLFDTGEHQKKGKAHPRANVAMESGKRFSIQKRYKWERHHNQIRRVCKFPPQAEIVKNIKARSPAAASLPLRCQELLGFHWEMAVRHGIQPGEHHFVWDLTNSAKFSCTKDPRLSGVVPCALRGHCLWDTALGRPLSGAELLQVHGFCLGPAIAHLSDRCLAQLAGDTISVPPVGCILALALANTASSAMRVSNQLPEHHVGSNWIGPSSWHGFDRSLENLMCLAGFPNKKISNKMHLKRKRFFVHELSGTIRIEIWARQFLLIDSV